MSFGSSAPSLSNADKDTQKIMRESLRMRQSYLPLLLQQFGFQATRHPGSSSDSNDQWDITKGPPTAQQQAMDQLAMTSLTGANDAAGAIRSRQNMAAGMLPGLLRSVQASMAPGTRSAGALGANVQSLPQFLPQTPPVQSGPPPTTPPSQSPSQPSQDFQAQMDALRALIAKLSQQVSGQQPGSDPGYGPPTGVLYPS